jgi:hypothetical protein
MSFTTKEAAEAQIADKEVYAAVFYSLGVAKVFGLPGAGWYVWSRVTKRVA